MKPHLTWDDFYALQRFGITPNLDNISLFCDRLGHPETSFPSIHVGGTNGKGSTVALLDSVLRSAGYKVGRYTSPHILRFEERICVAGNSIAEKEVFAFLEDHWDFIGEQRCTFFEVATALALDYFHSQKIDIAVMEVGLGGTYDATRVVQSILSIITRIDYDHTDRLGATLGQIAGDKAGIFRTNQPALTFHQRPEVSSVLRSRAHEIGAALIQAEDIVNLKALAITSHHLAVHAILQNEPRPLNIGNLTCPLTGSYQIENLTLALAACNLLRTAFLKIKPDNIKRGIEHVVWPGRLQELRCNPYLIADVGHNPGAVESALKNVREIWKPRNTIAIFSALRDKDIGAMLEHVRRETSACFLVPLPPPRGLSQEELELLAAQADMPMKVVPGVRTALAQALALAGPEDAIIALGSHYLVEEVLKNQNSS